MPHRRTRGSRTLRRALTLGAVAIVLAACGGVRASRGEPPPIPELLPASPPEAPRPIRVPPLRCDTFTGRSTVDLDRALRERAEAASACYRASPAAGAPVRGARAIEIDLAIADDGEVLGATVRDTDAALDPVSACVTRSFRGVRLPPPAAGCLRVAWSVRW